MITDDILHQFVVVGTYNDIGTKLLDRFRSTVTDCEFSIPVRDDRDRETLAGLVSTIQADDDFKARKAIVGDPTSDAAPR